MLAKVHGYYQTSTVIVAPVLCLWFTGSVDPQSTVQIGPRGLRSVMISLDLSFVLSNTCTNAICQ